MLHPQHHLVTICIQAGQSKCLLFKLQLCRKLHVFLEILPLAFTFSVKILLTTEQVSAASTLAVCWYPPPGKHHHRCNDFDDDKQQHSRSLVLTLPCRASPPCAGPLCPNQETLPMTATQSGITLVSMWDIKKFYIQFMYQHSSTYVTQRSWFLDTSL